MKIDKVTITGADDLVNADDLKLLSDKYPFVEWGILHSKSGFGTPRYPSGSVIDKLQKSGLNLSAHLCGYYSRMILETGRFEMLKTIGEFSRIQINYNFSEGKGWYLPKFIDWMAAFADLKVIFQVNKANQHAIDFLESNEIPENIHFLYDSSGGRGTVMSEIKPSFKNYTGYSGGLKPENIEEVVKRISYYPNPINVWIDMESGVRTNDVFDLDKVEDVLNKCKNYIKL